MNTRLANCNDNSPHSNNYKIDFHKLARQTDNFQFRGGQENGGVPATPLPKHLVLQNRLTQGDQSRQRERQAKSGRKVG